jgi:hypothetical protein
MKSLVMIGAVVGLSIGSYVPLLWGASVFSLSSVLLGAVGGLLGVWIGYKASFRFGP